MIEFENFKLQMTYILPELDNLKEALGQEKIQSEVATLEEQLNVPGFWDDTLNSTKVMQQIKTLKDKLQIFGKLFSRYEDTVTLIDMAIEENDESLLPEVQQSVESFIKELEKIKLNTLLSGEYDQKNAILNFHSGAGGTEAQDWALMLYRMYCRWAEQHDYKVKVIDMLDGDEAGIKSASIIITGMNAYGYLKSEMGVHRLVRISPFDASGRRHTSFAAVEVMPEIDDDTEVVIDDDDIQVVTHRSSGAGGQHVNKTDSAVRITHLPSGIVVGCQNERSQHQNKEMAMKMLKSKLAEIKEREHLSKIEDIKGDVKDNGWGSQIRSYVFMPYTMVKDHRSGFESGNVNGVMDGDLDPFINAYLKAASLGQLSSNTN